MKILITGICGFVGSTLTVWGLTNSSCPFDVRPFQFGG